MNIVDTVVSKLDPCRYYGGSESSDFRVACGIAQVNIGYGYISNTLGRLNIEPGQFCASYVSHRKSQWIKNLTWIKNG